MRVRRFGDMAMFVALSGMLVLSAGCSRRLEVSADFSSFPDGEPVLHGVDNICARKVDKNQRYKESARFLDKGSCLQACFEVGSIPETARLEVVHLSSASAKARNGGWSPVTVLINDQVVVKDHSPASHGYMTESWRVEPYLQKGRNTITFRQGELETHYWLQSFRITEGEEVPCAPTSPDGLSPSIVVLVLVCVAFSLLFWFISRIRKEVKTSGQADVGIERNGANDAGNEVADHATRLPDSQICKIPCNMLSACPSLAEKPSGGDESDVTSPGAVKKRGGCGWGMFVFLLLLCDPPTHYLQVVAVLVNWLLWKVVQAFVARSAKRSVGNADTLEFRKLCAESIVLGILAFCLAMMVVLRPMVLFYVGMPVMLCVLVFRLIIVSRSVSKFKLSRGLSALFPVGFLLLALVGEPLGYMAGKRIKAYVFTCRLPEYQRVIKLVAEGVIPFKANETSYDFVKFPAEYVMCSPQLLGHSLIGQTVTNGHVTVGIVTHHWGVTPVLKGYLYRSSGSITNSVFERYPFRIGRRITRDWFEFSYHD